MDILEQLDKLILQAYQSNRILRSITTTLSASLLLYCCINIVNSVYHGIRLYMFSQICKRTDYRERYGQWAVISGATDGVGLLMAKELAGRGHSIIVLGRNEVKLARVKEILEKVINVGEVETVKIDLSDSSLENFERIKPQIDPEKRDIGILINCAATLWPISTRLYNLDMDILRCQINVNILAMVYLSRMILPGMVSRGRGLVVNVSSIYGSMPAPFNGLYAITKNFVDSFSAQLNLEHAEYPVDIINLRPGPVGTKMFLDLTKIRDKSSLFIVNPDEYARVALNACSTKLPEFCGYWVHEIILGVRFYFHLTKSIAPNSKLTNSIVYSENM